MEKRLTLEQKIFYIIAFIGGAMGGFATLRTGVLGSAQTSNLVELAIAIVGCDLYHIALRVVAMILYAFGVAIPHVINKCTDFNSKTAAVIIDILGIIILGFMPEHLNAVVALWPIFFIMSFQWNSFPGARGYVSASIFSTNNFRQAVIGLTDYTVCRDRKGLDRLLFFTGTLVSFHLGVMLCCILIKSFGFRAVWFFVIPALAALPLIRKEQKENAPEAQTASDK